MPRFARALAVGAWLVASTVSAQVIYTTPFESPLFIDGNLTGQNSWTSTDLLITPGRGVIQSALAQTGARAVRIYASVSTSSDWFWKPLNAAVSVATAPIVQIKWGMYIDGTSPQHSAGWGIDVYDTSTPVARRVFAVIVDDQDHVQVWNDLSLVDTGVTLTRDAWHGFRVDLNYAAGARRANVFADNAMVAQYRLFGPSTNNVLGDVDLFNIDGAGQDQAYFDNLFIAALADGDGDGVADVDDSCLNTPPGDQVDAVGCSLLDSDDDGVLNDQDACPDTPHCATIDGAGCPSDTDGDAVLDGCDNCIGVPNTNQLDTDGDGRGDVCDTCPLRKPGDVNGDGKIDGGDIPRFKDVLLGASATAEEICASDVHEDGTLDLNDAADFVQVLLSL